MMPAWLIRAVPYLLVVAVVGAALGVSYHAGSTHAATKYELQISQERERHQQAIAAEMLARLAQERAAAAVVEAQDAKHQEEQKNAQADFDKRVADLRAERVRVTIPVVSCRTSGANAAAGNRETRAELDPAAAIDLEGIARDGDAGIRELNSCVDRYNAVRALLNQ